MEKYYIGTDTSEDSEGIYMLSLQNHDTPLSLSAYCSSPIFLCSAIKKRVLYAGLENKEFECGELAAYKIGDNKLHLLTKFITPCKGIVHVTCNREETLLFACCYRDAKLLVYRIQSNGCIGELLCTRTHEGVGVHPVRQKQAYIHASFLSPDETELFVCDLGLDKVFVYKTDKDAGLLSENPVQIKFPPATGPRHMVFSKGGRFAYVLAELSGEVYVLEHRSNEEWCIIQKIRGISFEPRQGDRIISTAAAIRITEDEKYLYTSNRGADTIAVFGRTEKDGKLQLLEQTNCGGKHPRDFILADSDRKLLCANRDTHDITIFRRDHNTGKIYYETKIDKISRPVCILEGK